MMWYESEGVVHLKEAGTVSGAFIALVGVTFPALKTLWVVEDMKKQQGLMQQRQAVMQQQQGVMQQQLGGMEQRLGGVEQTVSKILVLLERRT